MHWYKFYDIIPYNIETLDLKLNSVLNYYSFFQIHTLTDLFTYVATAPARRIIPFIEVRDSSIVAGTMRRITYNMSGVIGFYYLDQDLMFLYLQKVNLMETNMRC